MSPATPRLCVFVGLGNLGQAYQRHRHNIGFMGADAIARAHGFPAWRERHGGLLARARLGETDVVLFKPQTAMNDSGVAVGRLVKFYRFAPSALFVLHDELDLAFGKSRIKQGGGTAGHNGLASLAQHIGNQFWRVRLGIGHPGDKDKVTPHVLGNFSATERTRVEIWMEHLAEVAPLLAEGNAALAQTRLQEAMRA